MPKSSAASTASGMLSDLKSRLGFSRDKEDYNDEYDEYDDFDDEGYNERDDREYAGYGADYDEKAPVGGYRATTAGSGRYGRPDSSPALVSREDVKARTSYDSYGSSDTSTRRVNGRDLIDDRAPAQSSPAYLASQRARERQGASRSEGLDSLFEPSVSPTTSYSSRSSSTYEPSTAGYGASRKLTVVRPVSYADAERVARALKAGDVVVLAMRATSEGLMKRILDFSFGAASVLDASVECPGDRVFAIARGAGISEDEKRQLRSQGVL